MSIKSIMPKAKQAAGGEMTFLEHLEELRWHIIRALASVALFGIVIFSNKEFVFDRIIFGPKWETFPTYKFFCKILNIMCTPPQFMVQAFKVEEKFITHLKVSIILGIIISFPYIFWEIWKFIKPGLYQNERKAARGIVFVCSALFLLGVLFGYFVISPFALNFLTGYQLADTISTPTLTSYVNNMAMYTVPTGIVFELPVVVYFFTKIGLITPQFLKQYRKMAFVVILVMSAIITPPDVMTQFLIGVPLYVLYEISIIISQRVVTQQEKEMASA